MGTAGVPHTLPRHLAARPPWIRRARRLRPHFGAQGRGMAVEPHAPDTPGQRGPQPRRSARLHQPAEPHRAPLARPAGCRGAMRHGIDRRLRAVARPARPRPTGRMALAVRLRRPRLLTAATSVALVTALVTLVETGTGDRAGAAPAYLPPVGHVFVINLENKGYDETWGPGSKAPYLSQTLRAQGNLLSQYYGIAHNSLGNYIAQISGQGPNTDTQGDCQTYSAFHQVGTASPGQAVGQGCVYPSSVPTLAGQLTAAGRSWKGYMEDMRTPCRHPQVGAVDDTQKARPGDQYATRHNPSVYSDPITASPTSAAPAADLPALPQDLQQTATTPNLSYITPNLCNDAHDAPCVDGAPGGLVSADAWLRSWVPTITSSPAFQQDGMLII